MFVGREEQLEQLKESHDAGGWMPDRFACPDAADVVRC